MFIGHPPGNYDRLLDFSRTVTGLKQSRFSALRFLGTGGDEIIHALLDVMYAKAPYTVIQRAMHIHTVAEYLPTVLSTLEPFAEELRTNTFV